MGGFTQLWHECRKKNIDVIDFHVNYDLTTDWPEVAFTKKLLCVVWRCIFPRHLSIAVCIKCNYVENITNKKK